MERAARRETLLQQFRVGSPIARTLGLVLSFTEDDGAVIHMPYNADYDQAAGAIQGGMYGVVMDAAGWCTSAVSRDETALPATAELSMHLLRAVHGVGLRAEGHLLKAGKRQDVVEMFLYNDVTGELVGHATGTFVPSERISSDVRRRRRTARD